MATLAVGLIETGAVEGSAVAAAFRGTAAVAPGPTGFSTTTAGVASRCACSVAALAGTASGRSAAAGAARVRFIPGFVPSLQQLGLPNDLSKLTTFHQGMVLVTGPSGCGKSTTLASLVNIINEERNDHILTIEDPVEYLHASKRCLVNQRHAGRHTASFARALRGALREDPDVIVIGELRDLETISLAMTAAETGHLVLSTLHTNSAVQTITRIIDIFPERQQPQVRAQLSLVLQAVISQQLLPKADGRGRTLAT